MSAALQALADSVENSKPDREMDCAIAVAALGFFEVAPKWEGGPIGYGYIDADGCRVEPGHGGDQLVPRFTTSLDAALKLVPPEYGSISLLDFRVVEGEGDGVWVDKVSATLTGAGLPWPRGYGYCRAHALAIASIRALAISQATDSLGGGE